MPEDIPAIFEVNYQAFAHDDGARLVAPFTVADDVFMILALEPGALDGIQAW